MANIFGALAKTVRLTWRFIASRPDDIHLLALKGNSEAINSLLDSRPDLVNLVDKMDSGTPLHWAAIYGQRDACKTLLARGANVNALDDHEKSPIFWAVTGKEVEVAKLLIKAGADLRLKNEDGETPLDYATKQKREELAAVIRASSKPAARA
jgi:ankyrin repeat protein